MKERPRFLVLRGGAIGDFIMTLPALEALRVRWPGAEIEIVGYPHVAALAVLGGLADRVRSLNEAGMARFFAVQPMFSLEQAEYIRSFDLIVSYLHDPHGVVCDNLEAAGAVHVIYGSPLVTSGHAVEHLLKPLEQLAVYPDAPCPRLALPENIKAEGRALLERMALSGRAAAVHPGSGSPKKNWPIDRYIALARALRDERGLHVFFVIGEADSAERGVLEREAPGFPVLEGRTLVELASALADCALYVGNDSGVTHLAAAVGTPVVALFGPSDATRWGPRGGKVRICAATRGDLQGLGLQDVLAAAGSLF